MEFNAQALRTIRYRMNWTQEQMARSLGCSIDELADREHGTRACEFSEQEKSLLLVFRSQADANSAQVQRRAVADDLMASRGLAQIVDGDVIECLNNTELGGLSFR